MLAATSSAFAGGVVETPPPPVTIAPELVYDWTGPYAGAVLGFGHGVYGGNYDGGGDFPDDGEADLEGHMFSGVLGYSMRSGNVVYGGELGLSALDMSGSEPCPNPAFSCEMEVDSMVSLSGRVGYLASERMMVYGALGVAAANVNVFTDEAGGIGRNGSEETATGAVFGLGMEYAVSESMRLRGGISHYAFGEENYEVDSGSVVDPDFSFTNVEIGVLFQF